MTKSKVFTSGVLLLAVLLVANGVLARPMLWNSDDVPMICLNHSLPSARVSGLNSDEFMTFRWMYSSDGGQTWHNNTIYGAGNTGMIDTTGGVESPTSWGQASYRFGALVDGQNNIHFVAVLNSYLEAINPLDRQNGLYDVRCSADGETVAYKLIVAQAADHEFVWSDCGMNAAGELYALWVDVYGDNMERADILVTKSRDNGDTWLDQPLRIAEGLDVTGGQESVMPYPHMTYNVDEDFFYVIYQTPVEGTWVHHVIKVPSGLTGQVEDINTEVASAAYVSYYVSSVNPIAMDSGTDPATVYFCVRDAGGGTAIGNLGDAGWSVTRLAGAQRYPSMALDTEGEMPFVISNYGVPGGGAYHRSWRAWDDLGYNGGSWVGPIPADSVIYDGPRDLLYCNQQVWTSEGRTVLGENVWGQFTPEGFRVKYSDDDGDAWSEPIKLWSIFDEGETMSGGFIAQNILLAGANNHVFVAFCGKWGETDFDGPVIGDVALSSYMLGENWLVTVPLSDLNGIEEAYVNWLNLAVVDSLEEWEAAGPDTVFGADVLDNGTYQFTIPNDIRNDSTAVAAGDSIWFYVDCIDQLNNYSAGYENLLIVNQGWQGVWRRIELPQQVELGQNYPNPFNNSTVIPFSLNRTQRITLKVWDTNGRLVDTVVDGVATAGHHTVAWNAENVTSGVYIYTLETPSQRFTGKMTLIH